MKYASVLPDVPEAFSGQDADAAVAPVTSGKASKRSALEGIGAKINGWSTFYFEPVDNPTAGLGTLSKISCLFGALWEVDPLCFPGKHILQNICDVGRVSPPGRAGSNL